MEDEATRLYSIAFLVSFFQQRTGEGACLSVLGNALRFCGCMPCRETYGGLRKYFETHSNVFIVSEEGDNASTCRVHVRHPETYQDATHCLPAVYAHCQAQSEKMVGCWLPTSTRCPSASHSESSPSSVSHHHQQQQNVLERRIVAYILDTEDKTGQPASMPGIGEFCSKTLGIHVKGKLKQFLTQRPHLFHMPDTGRQHVMLTEGAALAVGLGPIPDLPDVLLHADNTAESEFQGTTFSIPGVGVYPLLHRHSGYNTWDTLTQKVYDVVYSAGGVMAVGALETSIKSKYAHLLSLHSTMAIEEWHVGSTVYKYPHVFHRLHKHIALVDRVKPAQHYDGTEAMEHGGGVLFVDGDFPPLVS